ncbi:MAG: hypothetical protein ACI9JM_000794 [Halioglobus sp.]|jgi:hypothetical protein
MNIFFRTAQTFLLLAWPCVASADLTDIGDGLVYDDYSDVTWIQDANYMQASGAHPDGRVSWTDAHAYAESLEYSYGAQNVVLNNWRLPSAFNFGTSYICTDAPCNQSELGHLQHVDGFGLFLSVSP